MTTPTNTRPQGGALPNEFPKYCLHCEKVGHRTNECWSTHVVNARWHEIAALATPAAAQGAVNAIAALVPQIEDSIHGKRYRCQQCGYAWGAGLDGSEAHATNCAYVIATSVPHTPPAAVAATPAPEVAPSAKEDGHA